jgi:Tfp pilus assembly protein PilN
MKAPVLHLDFAPASRRVRLPGMALLALGGVAFVAVAGIWNEAWSAHAAQQRTLATLERQDADATTRSGRAAKADPVEVAREQAMRRVARGLQTPWIDLLGAIEAAPRNAVALLAVEPSKAQQVVRLTAEARDLQAMVGYLAALQTDRRLAQVVLTSHQVLTQAPGAPVRFQIQASWGAAP